MGATATPPLPLGYTLDPSGMPPLPPGYSLDAPVKPAPNTASNPSTVLNPRLRNLPDPSANETSAAGALYHGVKAGATLATLPLIPMTPIADLALGATGGAVGSAAGKVISKSAGAGELGQEVASDVGGVVGGVGAAKTGNWAAGKARAIYDALPEAVQKELVGIISPRYAHAARVLEALGVGEAPPAPVPAAAPPKLPPGFTPAPKPLVGPPGSVDNPFLAPTSSTPTEPPNASPAASQTAKTGQEPTLREVLAAEPGKSAPKPAAKSTAVKPAQIEALLREALGAPGPLKKNVPLRLQNLAGNEPAPAVGPASAPAASTPAPSAPAPETPALPKDFTPTPKSSVLAGYKYDPEVREFSAITKSGEHYRTGDIKPEDVKDFEAADSPGNAWTTIIRQRGTPIGKMVDGVLKPWRTSGVSATPEGQVTPHASPLDQKLNNLQDFIRPAAKPKTLADLASPKELGNPDAATDLTSDWSKALAEIQGAKPANETTLDALAREGEAQPEIQAAYRRTLQQKIGDPATSYSDRIRAIAELTKLEHPELQAIRPRGENATRQRFKGGQGSN